MRTLGLDARNWIRIGAATLGVLVVIGVIVLQMVNVSVTEFYSVGSHSATSDEAKAAGILVATPVIADSVVSSDRGPFLVHDVWIEERTHIKYHFLFFRQRVREGTFTLLVVARRPESSHWDRELACVMRSAHDAGKLDTIPGEGWSPSRPYDLTMMSISRPFPDTLRFIALAKR